MALELLAQFEEVPVLPAVIDEAIRLRRLHRLKTPDAIVARLNAALNQVLNDKATFTRLSEMGFQPTPNTTPAALAAFTKAELDKWTPIIKASGVKLD